MKTSTLVLLMAMFFALSSFTPVTSPSSASSGEECSATVHLKFKDGDEVYKGECKAYFKGFLSTGYVRFTTDKKGYGTIRWSKSQGDVINCIVLERNIGFNDTYTKEGLNIEDGGNYEICMDCR